MSGIVWQRSPSDLAGDIEAYAERVRRAVLAVGDLIAERCQNDARANAPWTDRSGQARQGLTGVAVAAGDLVTVYLYHQAEHGKWLEIARGGPYRIIIPTLTAHYGDFMALIGQVLGEAS